VTIEMHEFIYDGKYLYSTKITLKIPESRDAVIFKHLNVEKDHGGAVWMIRREEYKQASILLVAEYRD
jgi:hypothetical protein